VTCGALGIDPNSLSLADYAGAIFQHNLRNGGPDDNKPQPEDHTDEEFAEIERLMEKEGF
jgi:hypothetical protein